MISESTLQSEVEQHGFSIRNGLLSSQQVDQLLIAVDRIPQPSEEHRRGGIRNLLECREVRELAASLAIRNLVEPVLGCEVFPVRAILFDKVPEANWKVPWHQDVTIAVQERVEVDGFGPWSLKSEVLHVQPPAQILEQMLSVRIHLDSCRETNGALKVIPGSHNQGRIPESQIADLRAAIQSSFAKSNAVAHF